MEDYKVIIKECSKELTPRERIMMKDTSNAIKLDDMANDGNHPVISPDAYAVLSVHNDRSENKDYEVYVIIDKDGKKYATGSPSFFKAFKEIWDEMKDEDEGFSIEMYKMDSKNYKGKQFLTCSIV